MGNDDIPAPNRSSTDVTCSESCFVVLGQPAIPERALLVITRLPSSFENRGFPSSLVIEFATEYFANLGLIPLQKDRVVDLMTARACGSTCPPRHPRRIRLSPTNPSGCVPPISYGTRHRVRSRLSMDCGVIFHMLLIGLVAQVAESSP